MDEESQQPEPAPQQPQKFGIPWAGGAWIAIGVAFGLAIGLALDNILLGLPIGIGFGVAMDAGARASRSTRGGDDADEGTPPPST